MNRVSDIDNKAVLGCTKASGDSVVVEGGRLVTLARSEAFALGDPVVLGK